MAKKVQLGKVEPKLNEDLVEYANLIGISKINLLEELITKELEGKVLTNDFIELEEVYYFNFIELRKNKTVKATKKQIKTDLSSVFIVKKIPNNLDVFDKDKRTFCYDGIAEEHLGVYSYNRFVLNEVEAKDSQLFQDYLLFEYNSKTEELTIKLTSTEDIFLMLDVTTAEDVVKDLVEFNEVFSEAIERVKKAPEGATYKDVVTFDNTYINLGTYLTSILVIEPLSHAKSLSYAFYTGMLEAYEDITKDSTSDLVLINDVVKTEEGVHIRTVNYANGGSKNG